MLQNRGFKNSRKLRKSQIIIQFLPFLWVNKSLKLRFGVILALILIPVTVLLNTGLPMLFREIINELSYKIKTNEQIVFILIFSYGFFWTISTIVEKIREMVFYKSIARAVTDYIIVVFKHIHSLDLIFHLGRQTGKLTTALDYAGLGIIMVITNILFCILPRLLEITLAFGVIWYLYGSYYAMIMIGTLIIYFSWSLLTSSIILKRQREWMRINSIATARFVDGLLNIETTTYFNRHEYEIDSIRKLHKVLDDTVIKLLKTTYYVQIIHSCIIGAGLILITYNAGREVLNHQLLLGDFILINGYLLQFLGPLYQLGMHIQNTRTALAELEPSTELLMEESREAQNRTLPPLILDKTKTADLDFEKVSFSYLPERLILSDLTFTVDAGSTVAIVGPSGSGKSTITRLILQFFAVNSGRIKINNQDIQMLNPNSIREIVGVVPQDIVLFNNSLRYNLCYGTFEASEKELADIIRITQLESIVKQLPEGLDTLVGERGLKLSGGERQRIALARALLRRPAILIFDEATSSLDVKTEQAIKENIELASQNTTTIIVAHRLSTVVNADKILVLNLGKITEQGTHHQLLAHRGLYSALWYKQRVQEPEKSI